jgi:hypothetical protein
METLTPAQRILVTIIVLALTVIVAAWVLPWLSDQLDARLNVTPTPAAPPDLPTATPVSFAPSPALQATSPRFVLA